MVAESRLPGGRGRLHASYSLVAQNLVLNALLILIPLLFLGRFPQVSWHLNPQPNHLIHGRCKPSLCTPTKERPRTTMSQVNSSVSRIIRMTSVHGNILFISKKLCHYISCFSVHFSCSQIFYCNSRNKLRKHLTIIIFPL
jgi:hypothetical protein